MFDNFKPIDPRAQRRKLWIIAVGVVAVILGVFLYYQFRNYPEEHKATQFFQALERKDYQQAYRIWQPGQYYTFKDFSQDWGAQGVEGPVNDFRIANSESRGSGVVVTVTVNGNKPISLWVEKKDKSLDFPP